MEQTSVDKMDTLEDLINSKQIKISVNSSGSSRAPMEDLTPTGNLNDLKLVRVKLLNGKRLFLTGTKVNVHFYGDQELLEELESKLEDHIGHSWDSIKQIEVEHT